MPAELARVEQWMYSTLSGDATVNSIMGTRIYADEAPQGTGFPLIIFAHRKAIEIAGKSTDPITNPRAFHMVYWTVMGGYGFAPHIPGRIY